VFSASVRDVFASWTSASPADVVPVIDWSLLAAAGSIIGIGLHEVVETTTVTTAKSTALFADLATEEVWFGSSLLNLDALPALEELIRTTIGTSGLGYTFTAFAPPLTPEDLNCVVITPSGALQIRVNQYILGPRTLGEPVVEIDPELAPEFLSDVGHRVRDAVMSGAPLTVPEPPPPPPPPDCANMSCVALTFDDGPDEFSLELIDILTSLDAPATVFLQGNKTAEHPELAQAYAAAGIQLCGHAYTHRQLTRLSLEEVSTEFVGTLDQIAAATGIWPNCQRPPYGSVNAAVASVSPTPLYLWTVDPRDWEHQNAATTHGLVIDAVTPGAIVLLHETHHSTLEALPAIIADLRAAGYTLVTIDTLMAGLNPQPGGIYSSR